MPKLTNFEGCVNLFGWLYLSGEQEVYPVAGLKAYAAFLDVKSNEELDEIITASSAALAEEYTIYPLVDLDYAIKTIEKFHPLPQKVEQKVEREMCHA